MAHAHPPLDPVKTERAWVEVNPSALRANLATVTAAVGPDVKIIPMVKADGYGLGVADVVDALDSDQVYAWGVATVAEGSELRQLGVSKPVMVFSPVWVGALPRALADNLTVTVSSLEVLAELRRLADATETRASFQVEVDTGIGRAGFPDAEVTSWREALGSRGPNLKWSGCFTHLHSADEVGGAGVAEQERRFEETLRSLGPLPDDCLTHYCNSAGALRLHRTGMDAVRPGIFLYGGSVGPDLPSPHPVVRVSGRIVHLRKARAGDSLGYGATHRATKTECWATVALGYGDGLPRCLGNRGHGIVAGTTVPILGRISMDMTTVDVTQVSGVRTGDPVTFVGGDQGAVVPLDEVARLAGTISYEILTGLGARLPRVWLTDETEVGRQVHEIQR